MGALSSRCAKKHCTDRRFGRVELREVLAYMEGRLPTPSADAVRGEPEA